MEMAACWDVENRPHTAPDAAVAAITPKGASQMNLMEWLKDKFASSENVDEVFSELADAEKFAAMVGEIEAFKAQVAAVEAERDEAKAEVEQLKAATSEIDEAHTTAIAEITAKVVEAEEAKGELQAKHDALMGGMKKPEDKPAAKGSKFPATAHYMELVKQLTEECGDVEAATIKAKTEYAEDFAAMVAEHPARKEA
jgi:chromosome segregation ATPase